MCFVPLSLTGVRPEDWAERFACRDDIRGQGQSDEAMQNVIRRNAPAELQTRCYIAIDCAALSYLESVPSEESPIRCIQIGSVLDVAQ